MHMKNTVTSLMDFLGFEPLGSLRAILHWLKFVSSEQIFRTLQKGYSFYSKVERDALCNQYIMAHSSSLQSVSVNLLKEIITLLS